MPAPAVKAAFPAALPYGAKHSAVTLAGEHFADPSKVEFSEGVVVTEVRVLNPNTIVALVDVPEDRSLLQMAASPY